MAMIQADVRRTPLSIGGHRSVRAPPGKGLEIDPTAASPSARTDAVPRCPAHGARTLPPSGRGRAPPTWYPTEGCRRPGPWSRQRRLVPVDLALPSPTSLEPAPVHG